jgi:putative transposase
VSAACRLYGVSRAGYYVRKRRGRSARREQDQWLLGRIEAIYQASEGTYGSPRICRALRQANVPIGHKRVARLMRQGKLRARAAKVYRRNPAIGKLFFSIPNRTLKCRARSIDQLWSADITFLKLLDGWRYLAVVMDRWSRRIVGWALGTHKDVTLTLRALNHAIRNRRPRAGLIFHTDRGSEYGAYELRTRLAALGILQSMNRPGEPTDNAHMESFFHSMKTEFINGRSFSTDAEFRAAIARYITFYNRRRLHSALDYRCPVDYERAAA